MEEKEKGMKKFGEEEVPSVLPPAGLAEDVLGNRVLEKEKKSKKENNSKENPGKKEEMKFVTFFLEKEEYALPINQVQEINRVGEITRVPNSPTHVLGVMNLRGKIVPVIELKQRLKLGKAQINKESRIVVVEQGPKVLGLLVDRVAQVLNISSDQIESAPEEVVQLHENFVKSIGKIDNRMVILLDLEKVISSNNDKKMYQ